MAIHLLNAPGLPAPQGFHHASICDQGRLIHLAGQIGQDEAGILADGLAAQTTQALANVVEVLDAAGADPEHLVKTTMYVVGYRDAMQDDLFAGIINAAAQTPLPAVPVTLIGVQSLFLDDALVEVEAIAMVPSMGRRRAE